MGAGLILLNVVFAAFVLVAIPGTLMWAIRTAHRDHQASVPGIGISAFERPLLTAEPESLVLAAARAVVVEEPLAVEPTTA